MKPKNPPEALRPDPAAQQEVSVTEAEGTAKTELPAPAEGPATAATGMPIDQFHGRGGTYIFANGVRTLAD